LAKLWKFCCHSFYLLLWMSKVGVVLADQFSGVAI
jgi:hypothetical protein